MLLSSASTYAGAQKNVAPAGKLMIVIVRKDLIGKAPR